jgi:hypothetical protein
MSSTPNTEGYRMSVMPTFQGADPRLFNPYGSMSTGMMQGIDAGVRLQDIVLKREQEARLKEQMAYGQAMRPLKEQGMRLENATRQRALEQPVWNGGFTEENQYAPAEPQKAQVLDENGVPMRDANDNFIWENVATPDKFVGVKKVERGTDWHGNTITRESTVTNPYEAQKYQEELALKQATSEREQAAQVSTDEYHRSLASTGEQKVDIALMQARNPHLKKEVIMNSKGQAFERLVDPWGNATTGYQPVMLPTGEQAQKVLPPQVQGGFSFFGTPQAGAAPTAEPAAYVAQQADQFAASRARVAAAAPVAFTVPNVTPRVRGPDGRMYTKEEYDATFRAGP